MKIFTKNLILVATLAAFAPFKNGNDYSSTLIGDKILVTSKETRQQTKLQQEIIAKEVELEALRQQLENLRKATEPVTTPSTSTQSLTEEEQDFLDKIEKAIKGIFESNTAFNLSSDKFTIGYKNQQLCQGHGVSTLSPEESKAALSEILYHIFTNLPSRNNSITLTPGKINGTKIIINDNPHLRLLNFLVSNTGSADELVTKALNENDYIADFVIQMHQNLTGEVSSEEISRIVDRYI